MDEQKTRVDEAEFDKESEPFELDVESSREFAVAAMVRRYTYFLD